LATLAREQVQSGEMEAKRLVIFTSSIASLWIDGDLVHNSLKDAFGLHIREDKTQKYFLERIDWSNTEFESINWEALGRTMKSFKHGLKINLVKIMFGWQFNNKWKKLQKKINTDKVQGIIDRLAQARGLQINEIFRLVNEVKATYSINGCDTDNGQQPGRCVQYRLEEDITHLFSCQNIKMMKAKKQG